MELLEENKKLRTIVKKVRDSRSSTTKVLQGWLSFIYISIMPGPFIYDSQEHQNLEISYPYKSQYMTVELFCRYPELTAACYIIMSVGD